MTVNRLLYVSGSGGLLVALLWLQAVAHVTPPSPPLPATATVDKAAAPKPERAAQTAPAAQQTESTDETTKQQHVQALKEEWLPWTDAQAPPTSQPPAPDQFVAYDCSLPSRLRAVTIQPKRNCTHPVEPVRMVNRTMLLLQQADTHRVTVRTCKAVRSQISHYCGATDHQTFMPMISYFGKKVRFTEEQCRTMWKTGEYTDWQFRQEKRQVVRNGTTRLQYEPFGRTWWGYSDAQCHGDIYYDPDGSLRHDVNMYVDQTVTLEEVIGLVTRDGTLTLEASGRQMGDSVETEHYEHEEGSAFWDAPGADECHLFKTRTITGVEVEGDDGSVMFMSTDGALVRLVKGGAESRCGGVVYSTNYDRLFLADDATAPARMREPLHVSELSVVTYVNQQDSFLHGRFREGIREELKTVVRHLCMVDNEARTLAYARRTAEQQSKLDGDTVALGSGWFATTAGEAYYQYHCRAVEVTAKSDETTCYSALPVSLSAVDMRAYMAAREPPAGPDLSFLGVISEPLLYMTPHSRLLTEEGIPMPCATPMAPLYKNAAGDWLAAQPHLQPVATPELLKSALTLSPKWATATDINFNDGGIYTAKTLQQMHAYLQTGRRTLDLSVKLAEQMHGENLDEQHGHITVSDVFPGWMPNLGIFTKIWGWTQTWGALCSALIGGIFAIKILTFIIGWIARTMGIRATQEKMSWPRALLHGASPSISFATLSHRVKKDRQRAARATPDGTNTTEMGARAGSDASLPKDSPACRPTEFELARTQMRIAQLNAEMEQDLPGIDRAALRRRLDVLCQELYTWTPPSATE